MKSSLINIILFILLLNTSYSFQDSFYQLDKINFKNEIINNISENKNNNQLKLIGLSALFPGLGHFYMGKNDVGAIYSWVELSGWMIRENYNNKIDRSSKLFKEYAREHWSLAKWIKDYFNPKDADVTIVHNNCISNCAYVNDVTEEVYASFIVDDEFSKPWDHSHKIEFMYNSNVQSTSSNGFIEIYKSICNTDASHNYICLNASGDDVASLEEIEEKLNNEDLIYTHHLYEGISKYNMYFAGWDDSNKGYMQDVGSGYRVVYSPHKLFYENTLRAEHKRNNDSANNILSAILINRAVSVLDIILRSVNVSVSTESNFNELNKYGINKINFSIGLN